MKTFLKQIILITILPILFSCHRTKDNKDHYTINYHTWGEIEARDTINVGVMVSPTDYYLYRGEPFGYQYKKVVAFAEKKGLVLDLHLGQAIDSLKEWLQKGKIDVCITPLAMTKQNRENYLFCGAVDTMRLVLAQNRNKKTPHVTELYQLANKVLHVPANTTEEMRARQIQKEQGLEEKLQVISTDTLDTQDLLHLLMTDSCVHYTIADKRLASSFKQHYSALDISTPVSVPIHYAWFVNKCNKTLASVIDQYFKEPEQQKLLKHLSQLDLLYMPQHFQCDIGNWKNVTNGQISPYDDIFKEHSTLLGWHWSILAAIAYQESRFQSNIIGWSGARGLMGIMPATGKAYGVPSRADLLSPEISVQVAVQLLNALKKYFLDLPETEKTFFILAAYNAGIGHVLDAQRLAKKSGANPHKWYGHVRDFMLLKSSPKYYNDPVVKYGYVRGREPVLYVDQVLARAKTYQAHLSVGNIH